MHVDTISDAVIVGQLADLSIFVLRENYTDRRKLTKLTDFFNSRKIKNMHIILNASNAG
jgi:Mrp family chromosome partitioning ATPase